MAGGRTSDTTSDAHQKPARRVGWVFIALYAAAYLATSLVFIAPLLVTLALKVNSLVGTDRAASSLSLVAATGSLVALVANPLFGRLSDRTTSRWGMRRPWMMVGLAGGSFGILVVALAPTGLGGADRLVPGAAVLQRDAGRDGGGAARPGPGRAAGHGRRRPRRLPPHRVGGRHLRGEGLHRQRAGDVPGSVRHRGVLHRRCSRCTWTTVGSPRRTSRRGR